MLNILNSIWPYAIAVLMFLILIIIHEFGHFIMSKSMGVKVNEFAVGFGPKLFSKQVGETAYSVNLVPFGGYCAIEGEEDTSDDPRAFCNKKAWQRAVILAAGAVFNIVLGLIIIAVTLAPDKVFLSTEVAGFYDNSVSAATGLEVDDKILTVDGRSIVTTYDLSYSFTAVKDGKMDMTVLRDGKKVHLKDVAFDTVEEDGISYISVDFYVKGIKKTVGTYIAQTFKTAFSYMKVIWLSIIDLIGGKFGISAMSGPVGITATIGSAAKQNLLNIMPIMALITINLGLINLLPFPALDGGRLLFVFIEMILGKPVPAKYESRIHTAGFVILIILMIVITAKDIWSLVVK